MTTMVENEVESGGREPQEPSAESDAGFAARFDKVEADMREGFARVDRSIDGLRGEMNKLGASLRTETNQLAEGLRTEMNQLAEGLRTEMNARFLALSADFNSLQRTMIGSAAAIVAALIGVTIF